MYSLSCVWLFPTHMDCSLPGSSLHGTRRRGCHYLLQGILMTQGSKPHLLFPALQVDFLLLSHQGSPNRWWYGWQIIYFFLPSWSRAQWSTFCWDLIILISFSYFLWKFHLISGIHTVESWLSDDANREGRSSYRSVPEMYLFEMYVFPKYTFLAVQSLGLGLVFIKFGFCIWIKNLKFFSSQACLPW